MCRLCPDRLVGIQFGSIGRKVLDVQTRMTIEEVLNRLTLMRVGIVEQDDDRTPQMAEQLPQKDTDFGLADVVEEQEVVQTEALPLRTDRDT